MTNEMTEKMFKNLQDGLNNQIANLIPEGAKKAEFYLCSDGVLIYPLGVKNAPFNEIEFKRYEDGENVEYKLTAKCENLISQDHAVLFANTLALFADKVNDLKWQLKQYYELFYKVNKQE